MNTMWEALEKYQKYADKRGFGEAWLKMTTERTTDAAGPAVAEAWFAAKAAWLAAKAAWLAGAWLAAAEAAVAAWLAMWLAEAAARAYLAVEKITRAIEQENENEC